MLNNTRFQVSALSAAIAATLLPSTQAIAQGPALEEVVVTATRRAESVQDVPFNITALNSDMLQRERISDLSDIARRVPGLIQVDQGPRNGNRLTVRGLNVSSIGAPETTLGNSGGDTVGIYMGEIPIYADWRINDIDRVEVLIGPQGTLYGAGTLAGAVRYLPNKPVTDELTLQVRGDVYDLNEADDLGYESGFTLNIPIIEDKLAVRAVLDYEDDPGFIDANYLVREAGVSNPQPDFSNPQDVAANLTSKEDVNTDETWSGRLAVRYTGESIDSTLTYYYQQSDIGSRQISHKDALVDEGFDVDDYESALRFEEPIDRENQLFALEIVADLGFAELTSATGYSDYEEDGSRDQTDLLLTFETGYELFPSFSAFTRDQAEEKTFTQELRLVSTSDSDLSWIVGAFYYKEETDQLDREFAPNFDEFALNELGAEGNPRPDDLEYYFYTDNETEEMAVFGEVGYQITDKWQVTVGARYFDYESEVENGTALPIVDTVFGGAPSDSLNLAVATGDGDDSDYTYKINTSYYITDDVMTYFTLSTGYRLGGANDVAPCDNDLGDQQNACALPNEQFFAVDETTNYEIGLRSTWGDNLVLNGAIYYIEWDDIQISGVTVNGSQPITKNGSEAVSQGIELTSQWYVTPELSIYGSYAYTDAELSEDSPELLSAGIAAEPVDAKDGDRLPGTPEHQAYLGVNYSLALNNGSSVEFDYSVTAISDVLTKVGERALGEELDGFSLHNVSATWLNDSWRVSLYADNVFDEYAETGVRNDTGFITQVENFDVRRYYHNVIRPRQIGLRFAYDFGG